MGPSPGVPELLLPLDDVVHIHSLLYLPLVELLDLILWRRQRVSLTEASSHVTPDSNHSPTIHPASDQRQVQASQAQIGQFALLISPDQVEVSVESGRKVKSEGTGSQATNAQLVISSPTQRGA